MFEGIDPISINEEIASKVADITSELIGPALKSIHHICQTELQSEYGCTNPLVSYLYNNKTSLNSFLEALIEKGEQRLMNEFPTLSKRNADYVLIPAFNFLICVYCETYLYDKIPSSNQVLRDIKSEQKRSTDALMGNELLTPYYFEDYWESYAKGKKFLEEQEKAES